MRAAEVEASRITEEEDDDYDQEEYQTAMRRIRKGAASVPCKHFADGGCRKGHECRWHSDICLDMCMDMCMNMCIDYAHKYAHVSTHVHTHTHAYAYVYLHVNASV